MSALAVALGFVGLYAVAVWLMAGMLIETIREREWKWMAFAVSALLCLTGLPGLVLSEAANEKPAPCVVERAP